MDRRGEFIHDGIRGGDGPTAQLLCPGMGGEKKEVWSWSREKKVVPLYKGLQVGRGSLGGSAHVFVQ